MSAEAKAENVGEGKWTKGPWVALFNERDNGIVEAIITDSDRDPDNGIADVYAADNDELIANTHLIAAAPDLYAVCKAALEHVIELEDAWQRGSLHDYDGQGGTRSNRNIDVRNALQTALAKALGK